MKPHISVTLLMFKNLEPDNSALTVYLCNRLQVMVPGSLFFNVLIIINIIVLFISIVVFIDKWLVFFILFLASQIVKSHLQVSFDFINNATAQNSRLGTLAM